MIPSGTRVDAYNERRLAIASRPDLQGIDGVEVVACAEDRCTVRLRLIRRGSDAASLDLSLGVPTVVLSGPAAADWTVVEQSLVVETSGLLQLDLARRRAPRTKARQLVLTVVHPQVVPPFDSVRITLDAPAPAPAALGRAANEDVVQASALPPPAAAQVPEIDYLAKDYAAFRRLMLDRMAVTDPRWTETHAADVGVAMVEILAYAADYLSYYQDAVGTETYLATARERPSVRRHARDVGYRMNEGCAPRAWLHFELDAAVGTVRIPPRFAVSGRPRGLPRGTPPRSADAAQHVYVTLAPAECDASRNGFLVYDHGRDTYVLAAGAMTADLVILAAGSSTVPVRPRDVLVFVQSLDPVTGTAADADPRKRHAVRVTRVSSPAFDKVTSLRYVTVDWAQADALPFDLVVASRDALDGRRLGALATALGNMVPAEYGTPPPPRGESLGHVDDPRTYRPALRLRDITYSAPFDETGTQPAAALTQTDPSSAAPVVVLDEYPFGDRKQRPRRWTPVRDLLGSAPDAPHFVIENENDRRAKLRFGDGVHGRLPQPGSLFVARYRAGNGPSGDVGADTLVQPYAHLRGVSSVGNPLPSAGGAEPTPLEQARLEAPAMIRTQRRCVVQRDYVAAALAIENVRAASVDAAFTGSWQTVRLFVQRAQDGGTEDAAFVRAVRAAIEPQRLVGVDLAVFPPSYVRIDAKLRVTPREGTEPAALRTRVDDKLASLLGATSFTFAQSVYPSPLVAAVASVPGVRDVRVVRLARYGSPRSSALEPPPVTMRAHEIALFDSCTIEYGAVPERAR
jgi:Baseplate J-like protein